MAGDPNNVFHEPYDWRHLPNRGRFLAEAALQYYYHMKDELGDDDLLDNKLTIAATKILEAVWVDTPIKHSIAKISEVKGFLWSVLSRDTLKDFHPEMYTTFWLLYATIGFSATPGVDENQRWAFLGNTIDIMVFSEWPKFAEIFAEWVFTDLTMGKFLPTKVKEAFITVWLINQREFAYEFVREALAEIGT